MSGVDHRQSENIEMIGRSRMVRNFAKKVLAESHEGRVDLPDEETVVMVRERDGGFYIQITYSDGVRLQNSLWCLDEDGGIYVCRECRTEDEYQEEAGNEELLELVKVIHEFDTIEPPVKRCRRSLRDFLARIAG